MAIVNPIYAFFVPFLCVVTIPLALFAGITSFLAFSVLIFRVVLVYVDVALSLVPQSIYGLKYRPYAHYAPRHSSSSASIHSNRSSSPTVTPVRRRRRRPSSASLMSAGSTTPVGDGSLGLVPSVGPERDFEGVGGWRVGEDENWTTINSRLDIGDRRHHHRSASGGAATTPGDGYLMMKSRTRSPEAKTSKSTMSPNNSRARTPTGTRIGFTGLGNTDGYFPLTPSPKLARKMPASAAE